MSHKKKKKKTRIYFPVKTPGFIAATTELQMKL